MMLFFFIKLLIKKKITICPQYIKKFVIELYIQIKLFTNYNFEIQYY